MKILLASAIAVLLPEAAPVPLPEDVRQAVLDLAEVNLFDAESARWRWPDYIEGRRAYCGYLNAKNRHGAYIGYRPFMVSLTRSNDGVKASDFQSPPTVEGQEWLLRDCVDRGSLIKPLPQ